MGLDHVEMVMEIEDEFRIHIPDDRAQQPTTAVLLGPDGVTLLLSNRKEQST